jgi:hypothetical protein
MGLAQGLLRGWQRLCFAHWFCVFTKASAGWLLSFFCLFSVFFRLLLGFFCVPLATTVLGL